MENSEYLSEQAYGEAERELKYLVENKRKEISEQLEDSASMGDLSENAEYQEAKDAQLMNERRIAELEDLLSRAVIISPKKERHAQIELSCFVVLRKDGASAVCQYQIVGSEESNPAENKISNESPLGTALLRKKKGDKIKVVTPAGEVGYTVMEIQ